ncbi:hypothetical protein [Streptosporangium carneum]|uniref:Polymerase nucleotidyl transferase domain-containing protein n=1 Tax=Streptosporangium carneum TaxID=47481 RepID=A0A9W6MH41_9ACTN|nr:hypothetical protein [Streptosporangium carneum]GLK13886.1 hypothetical protein GCM10017600_72970 [Streptosporangium carneum]
MTPPDEMARHLGARLAAHGKSIDDLVAEVDTSFGEPVLMSAAGSVVHGFGTPMSDIDVHVVVDSSTVTGLPITSFTLGVAVDVNYIRADSIRRAADALGDHEAPKAHGRSAWRDYRRKLAQLNRLILGHPLRGGRHWLDWQRDRRQPVADATVRWWRAEAVRYRLACELLRETRPLAAAERLGRAGIAGLDALATARGEICFGQKWVGAKLERLGDPELTALYERFLDLPVNAAGARTYLREAGSLFAELAARLELPPDPEVCLTPAAGLETWRSHGGRALVHRWALRGVETPTRDVEFLDDPAWSWTGRSEEMTETHRLLAEEDLLWLSIDWSTV